MPRSGRKPRLAIASPWPPQGSGIADYSLRLARSLSETYEIDAVYDPSIRPAVDPSITPVPGPLLSRLRPLRAYRNILYQMGNSPAHAFLYRSMLAIPGVVTLHDPRLTHFHEAFGERPEVESGHLEREIARERPEDWRDIVASFDRMRDGPGGLGGGLIARGIDLNRRIVERSLAVVVHSRWAADRIKTKSPEHASKIHHIPFGVEVETIDPNERLETRERLGIPRDAVVFASLGFLSRGKMNEEAIEAFAAFVRDIPSAIFLFAGSSLDGGFAEKKAKSLGLGDRVRFLGRCSTAEFRDIARACDVGVNLRRPPTNGETSAALLDLMRVGIPTIITDVDAFGDEPESAVVRVRWEANRVAGLVGAMRQLAGDAGLRLRVGTAAHNHVRAHHRPGDVATRYVELLESTATRRLRNAV